ncbi:hypothetical protein, partial [Thiolapillus sp.]|uniref:hypothetical protein n=1 Tax=Thiolapillus sp. TaxID=2017437 RepID=UPI003AF7C03B
SGSNRGPSAYQPSALPLGHIGSQETGVVGYTFYGVVPKGLLTFLGSLYKEGAKTTPGTLVYRFERQIDRKRKKFFLQKNTVLNLESRILSQKPSDSFILYFNVIFHGK